ncbi:hypothetical protein D3C78_1424030 [compost metagenome]
MDTVLQVHKADSRLISTTEYTGIPDHPSGRLILIHCCVNGKRKSGCVSRRGRSKKKVGNKTAFFVQHTPLLREGGLSFKSRFIGFKKTFQTRNSGARKAIPVPLDFTTFYDPISTARVSKPSLMLSGPTLPFNLIMALLQI